MTTTVECPFCHIGNDPAVTAGYCETCGRKLPHSDAYTTRSARRRRELTSGDEAAAPPSKYQTPEGLFTAAVLCLILGGGFLVIGPVFLKTVPEFFLPAVMGTTIAGTAFLGLMGLWAYRMPAPAAWMSLGAFVASWAVLLCLFLAAWPLALVDSILLGWLVWTAIRSGGDS
jgi:hypothetical protein